MMRASGLGLRVRALDPYRASRIGVAPPWSGLHGNENRCRLAVRESGVIYHRRVIRIAIVLALLGALLLLAGPLGSRVGLWPFIVGFAMVAVSVLLGLVGASLAL